MSIAPTIGGVTAHYYSWRTTQYGLCVAAIASFLLTLFFQPETAWPGARGVDKLIEKEGKSRWVWLNPFGSIGLLRSPNVCLVVSHLVRAYGFFCLTVHVSLYHKGWWC